MIMKSHTTQYQHQEKQDIFIHAVLCLHSYILAKKYLVCDLTHLVAGLLMSISNNNHEKRMY